METSRILYPFRQELKAIACAFVSTQIQFPIVVDPSVPSIVMSALAGVQYLTLACAMN